MHVHHFAGERLEPGGHRIEKGWNQWVRVRIIAAGTKSRFATVFIIASVLTGSVRISIGASGSACSLYLSPSLSIS